MPPFCTGLIGHEAASALDCQPVFSIKTLCYDALIAR